MFGRTTGPIAWPSWHILATACGWQPPPLTKALGAILHPIHKGETSAGSQRSPSSTWLRPLLHPGPRLLLPYLRELGPEFDTRPWRGWEVWQGEAARTGLADFRLNETEARAQPPPPPCSPSSSLFSTHSALCPPETRARRGLWSQLM